MLWVEFGTLGGEVGMVCVIEGGEAKSKRVKHLGVLAMWDGDSRSDLSRNS